MKTPGTLAIIAGSGAYPLAMARSARRAGVARLVAAAFQNETEPKLAELVEETEWMRVGQLGRLLSFLQRTGATEAVMAGQIHPKNLFDLRPDFKALLLLGKLKERNAESIFGAIAAELEKIGVKLLLATTYMEEFLAPAGLIAGRAPRARARQDVEFGFRIARETSRLDIGQTVVVRHGTVLAVEAFEGTNACIRRGGELGKKDVVIVKVSKPRQDLRFDVPVIGPQTLETAHAAGARLIAVEAGRTLLLEPERLQAMAQEFGISIWGIEE